MLLTLDKLKNVGAISVDYELQDYHGTNRATLAEVNFWSDKKKSRFDGVISCDNVMWAATLKKIPIAKASKVYTSDGKSVVLWDRKNRIAFRKELVGNKLVTISQVKMPLQKIHNKEDIDMAAAINLGANLADMDLGIGTDVTPASPETTAPAAVEGGKKMSAQAQLNKAMTEQFKDATIAKTNDTLINYNQRYGRAYGFITKTDKTVRLGLKNQFKTDANGNKILVPDADPAVKQQYQDYLAKKEGVKCPPLKFFMREHALNFRQSKPGKIIGMIIGTPVTVDKIDFNDIMAGKADFERLDNPELTTKILGIEYAYIYLVGNYDGRIMESNAVLGAAASWINVKGVVDTKAFEKTKEYKLRYSLKLEAASKVRKSLLIDGNYIPAKLYKSVAASAITAANAQGLNNSVLAIFKDGTERLSDLTDESKKLLINDNTCVKYFSTGADKEPIPAIPAFDGSGDVKDVQIAVRDAKVSSTGKKTFPFVFDDDFAHVVAKPEVAGIMQLAGLSADQLEKEVKALLKTKPTGNNGGGNDNSLDLETLKKFAMHKQSKDISDLSKILAGLK